LVFLEFFEALLDCALLYVTDEMLKQQAEEASQSGSSYRTEDYADGSRLSPLPQDLSSGQSAQTRSTSSGEASNEMTDATGRRLSSKSSASKIVHFVDVTLTMVNVTFTAAVEDKGEEEIHTQASSEVEQEMILSTPMKELADKLQNAKNEQKDKHSLWMSQIYIFFVNKFFAGHKHLQVVKETILDNRIWEAELCVLRKIQEEEEEAKLNAMREAEEARKLEEAAAEKAALELEESLCREMEEVSVQLPTPPKEESPVLPQVPPSSKTTTGGKKKKKAQ
ncbi:hypothetical protein JD844_019857, partial [Phrynosoma platyrhinos]